MPEAWLSGPVDGVPALLQPVAHALLQARDDVVAIVDTLRQEEIWRRPGASASIGFHALHLAGATDRLLTYARGEALSDEQRRAAAAEATVGDLTAREIVARVESAVARALAQVRATPVESLTEPRLVGRTRLPSTMIGVLFHTAEHATRHAGQITTLARIVRGT
jgi:uncharacterized damage-inducible protein DinB